jgi:hypothetical protein
METSSESASVTHAPIDIWQEEPLLLAALTPGDPERRLAALNKTFPAAWQWLPFIGPDFPLQTYAERGPVVAWIPHVGTGPMPIDHRSGAEQPVRPGGRLKVVAALSICLIVLLLGANTLLMLLANKSRSSSSEQEVSPAPIHRSAVNDSPQPGAGSSEVFAQALHRLLQNQQATKEWTQSQLLQEYQTLLEQDERLRASSLEGKIAVGVMGALSRRSAARVEELVREALAHKGYDDELVNLACVRIRERLAKDLPGTR